MYSEQPGHIDKTVYIYLLLISLFIFYYWHFWEASLEIPESPNLKLLDCWMPAKDAKKDT